MYCPFIVLKFKLYMPRPPRYNDRLLVYPAVRIRSSRHYFCFEGCAAVRCTIGCLLALIFLTFFFAIYAIRKQEQRKLHTVKFNKRGTATINKGLMLDLSLKSMQPILHIFVL
jgi:hypothetical protein